MALEHGPWHCSCGGWNHSCWRRHRAQHLLGRFFERSTWMLLPAPAVSWSALSSLSMSLKYSHMSLDAVQRR
jgi:hypothetical protein